MKCSIAAPVCGQVLSKDLGEEPKVEGDWAQPHLLHQRGEIKDLWPLFETWKLKTLNWIVCRRSHPSSTVWRSSKQVQGRERQSLRGMRRGRRWKTLIRVKPFSPSPWSLWWHFSQLHYLPGRRGQEARDWGLHCENYEEQEAVATQSACHWGEPFLD